MLICRKNLNNKLFSPLFYIEELYYIKKENIFVLRKVGGYSSPIRRKIKKNNIEHYTGNEVFEIISKEDAFYIADFFSTEKMRKSIKFKELFNYNADEIKAIKNQIRKNKKELREMQKDT